MAQWIEGRGWVRPWYWRLWGHGLDGIRGRYTSQETRYQWWPVRVRVASWRGVFAWWRHSILNWHGIEAGFEVFPFPVRNARREVLPNSSWPGQHYERWRRTVVSQVWHIGPLRIVCGDHALPPEDRLTDEHIRAIEKSGKVVVG